MDAAADAQRTLEDAKREVEESDERMWEAELHRLTGDALLMLDSESSDAVQPEYEHAVEIARSEGAKSLELRASTSLADCGALRAGPMKLAIF